jgi:thioesterase domain-containing protein
MRTGCFFAVFLAALTITNDGARAGGHVYALRGLINVFSYGMDSMVERCRARGIGASAHGHGEFPTLAASAAKLAKSGKGPIVIIGHSLGADAAVYMANEMKKLGAPVALLVLFGPTMDLAVPSNVRQVVNYYQATSAWRGRAVKGAGFSGSIANINLDKDIDVTHFNIEKLDRLQNQAMAKIRAHTGTGRALPSATASAAPTTTSDTMMSTVAAPPIRSAATASRAARSSSRTTSSKRSATSSNRANVDTPQQHGAF